VELIAASNTIIRDALFENGKTFQDRLEDYLSAIDAYEELLRRFPASAKEEEALFNLVYLYGKTNNTGKMESAKQRLLGAFPNGKYAQLLKQQPVSGTPPGSTGSNDAATKKYEEIYNLFIEGKFEQAKQEKEKADQLYGSSYWTPQLLFIESIYYIKQRQDSIAINRLTAIQTGFAATPLAEKATNMIDVLRRRRQIEEYLTNLEVERKEDDVVNRVGIDQQNTVTRPVPVDTLRGNRPVVLDPVKPRVDTFATKPPVVLAEDKGFRFIPTDGHYALLILDNVDPVYVTEAKNALARFNSEQFYRQRIDLTNHSLTTRYTLVLVGPFKDAATAVGYVDKAKPVAAARILPWLSEAKYSFLIISNANLDLLKQNKELEAYKKLMTETLPGKF
jgi:outer membrane protein assembly factor BamD (BamD/ComL family)